MWMCFSPVDFIFIKKKIKIENCPLVQTLQVGKRCETKHHWWDFQSTLKEQGVQKAIQECKGIQTKPRKSSVCGKWVQKTIVLLVCFSGCHVQLFCYAMNWSLPGPCPWEFTGKNTEIGCHFLLQVIFPTQGSNLCLLHWQADSVPLSHHGSPTGVDL